MSRVTISKPNELEFLGQLVHLEQERLTASNGKFENVDDMEAYVAKFRMTQELDDRFRKASGYPKTTETTNLVIDDRDISIGNDNIDNDNNNT